MLPNTESLVLLSQKILNKILKWTSTYLREVYLFLENAFCIKSSISFTAHNSHRKSSDTVLS
jgi:hypothetical protein